VSAYFFKRTLGVIPVMLLVTALVYGLLHLAPGDPVSLLLPEDATPADIAATRVNWGLDKPVYVQYVYFVRNALGGDLGRSFRFAQPVSALIAQRLPHHGAAVLERRRLCSLRRPSRPHVPLSPTCTEAACW
jgi:ABC-type dipeptide/oligopeptide/nickel transport system permease component